MTLTVRSATVTGATTKGSALTHAEMDANWAHVIDSSNQSFLQSGSGASPDTVSEELKRLSISPEQFGCEGDDSTDDSTNFQKAATAATGKTLTLTPGKTYRVANVSIPAGTDIDMRGAALKLPVLGTNVSSPILVIGGNNIDIYGGGTFDGNKSGQPADGFSDSFDGGAQGQGRAFRSAIKGEARTDIRIHGCHFKDTFGAAIAMENADRVSICNNTCDNLNFELAFLATTVGGHGDYVIQGNRGKDFASGDGSVNANAVIVSQADRVLVDGNIFTHAERTPIKSEGGNDITISNNVLTTVTVADFSGIAVQDNDAENVVISGNVIGNVGRGILLSAPNLTRVSVTGNTINSTTGTAGDGVQLSGATSMTDIVIANNAMYDIERHGVYVATAASRVKIAHNILYGQGAATQSAIFLTTAGTSADITVLGNHCENFVESAAADGVVNIARTSSGTFARLNIIGNTILAGASTNRGIFATTASDFILSGIVSDNYIDGLTAGTHSGNAEFAVTENVITGSQGLVGGGPGVLRGSAAPNTSVTACPGSIYLRSGGGRTSAVYQKEYGTGNTGWVPLIGGATDFIKLFDDFLGDVLEERWTALVGTDPQCAVSIATQTHRGVARVSSGDDAAADMATNGAQLVSATNWTAGQHGLVFEARVALVGVTATCAFIGFTDSVALEMPFTLGASDTLTSNATDAVGVLFDTAADTDNWWLVGVANNSDATKQDAGVAPSSNTMETWRIEITNAGAATFYRNGTVIGTAMSGAVRNSIALTPTIAVFSRAATVRAVDADYILAQQIR